HLKTPTSGELQVEGMFTVNPWFLQSRVLHSSPQGEIMLLPGKLVRGFETKALLRCLGWLDIQAILLVSPVGSNPGSWGQIKGGTPKKPLGCPSYGVSKYKRLKSKTTAIRRVSVPHWPRVARFDEFKAYIPSAALQHPTEDIASS